MTPEQESRFWAKVDKSGECWIWTGAHHDFGYGQLTVGGVHKAAHRLIVEHLRGPIPAGMDVMHSCDNPPCVRPDHLSVGSRAENMAGAKERHRMRNGVTIGSASPFAKLTEADVVAIRERYARGGIGQVRLGREYGVSRSVIAHVVHAKTWRHVATEEIRIAQHNPRGTHCRRGHPLVDIGSRQVCHECGRRRRREYEQRRHDKNLRVGSAPFATVK